MTDQSEKNIPLTEDVEDFEGHKQKDAADTGERNRPDIAERQAGRQAGMEDEGSDFEGHAFSSRNVSDLTERQKD